MTASTALAPGQRLPDLQGQTVVVIGGSAGLSLKTTRRARVEGADVILTARNGQRLERVAHELGALKTAALDATDVEQLERFFAELPGPIDHILVTAGGPHYQTLAEMDFSCARRFLDEHRLLPLHIARNAIGRIRPRGTLLFIGATGARRPAVGLTVGSAVTVGMPALVASLALEIAPARVNLIAAGYVDTPLSASLLGDQLDARRAELRDTLPIGRVVAPEDVAAIALHPMANTALTARPTTSTAASSCSPGGHDHMSEWIWLHALGIVLRVRAGTSRHVHDDARDSARSSAETLIELITRRRYEGRRSPCRGSSRFRRAGAAPG